MAAVGYFAFETRISWARMVRSTARLNDSTSKPPSNVRKCIRFRDARLHAESSRNMYSEHGFEALMRAVLGHGCQSLTVVSNCMPGSPHTHADSAILRIMSFARYVSITFVLSVTARVCHSASFSYARMNSSV